MLLPHMPAPKHMLSHTLDAQPPQAAQAHKPETARGMQARERMLRAALEQFGRHGLDGTSTRAIAKAAGMNLGAITYYFGTKDGLYVAAAAFLADTIEARQRGPWLGAPGSPVAPHPMVAPCDTSEQLIEQVVDFLCRQARVLLADDFPAEWVQFFLRLQAEEGPAFERLFKQVVAPMQDVVEQLIATLCGRSREDTLPRFITFLVAHQVMSLRLSDALLQRRLGWTGFTPDRIDHLLDLMAHSLRAQLAALTAPAP